MNAKARAGNVTHLPPTEAPRPTTLREYLDQLEAALAGRDPALIQDALYDAEEHLRSELGEVERDAVLSDVMHEVLESYGTPQEVAEAYIDADARMAPQILKRLPTSSATLLSRVFGVLLEPLAYTSIFFNILGLITGIVFFSWALTGAALTLGLSILIIGLPFALAFLASVRVLSLVEGRIVEGLLGVRMPRRPRTSAPPDDLFGRIRYWLKDGRTWSTWLYFLLRLPIGIVTFTVTITLLALSLGFTLAPFAQVLFDLPTMTFGDTGIYWPRSLLWVPVLLGAGFSIVTLHISKLLALAQAALAKAMLVKP